MKIIVKRDDKKRTSLKERADVVEWLESQGKLEPDTPEAFKEFVDSEVAELGVLFDGVAYTVKIFHKF